MKKLLNDYGFLLGISGLIVLLDQITKELVRRNLSFEEIWAPWEWLIPYARIIHWHNFGAALGFFQNGNTVIAILAVIVSILIVIYFPRIPREDWLLRLALAMQLGGAVGNLIDRISQGFVTDFISVVNFPVFNIADASISIGAVLLVVSVLLKDREAAKIKQTALEEEASSLPSRPTPETIPSAQRDETRDD